VSGMPDRVIVEADGGSRGNPGPAGYGAVVRDPTTGETLAERAEAIGRATNNVAEYRGLIAGLEAAAEMSPSAVDVRLDSKLIVEQMSGRWKVKHADLQPLARRAAELVRSLPKVTFTWVPRERNTHADRLANEAMDAAASSRPRPQSTVDSESADPAPRVGWGAPTGPPTTMLLLRHGETEHSVDMRFSGRNDLPLTALGREQAEASARRLSSYDGIDTVVCSPLRRAQETAVVVAKELGADPVEEPGLAELDFGDWEGLTFAEVRERWPEQLDAWLASPDVAPPGGESITDVTNRVRRARNRMLTAHPGGTILVVSHVTPIKILLRIGLDAPTATLFRLHLDIASLSTVDWYADGPASVRLVNDTSHLS
jgi:ribonuclease H / adenosylcobalamin/alpha-ribazole phosphatase